MGIKELQEYLKIVLDMEQELFFKEKLKKQIQHRIAMLGRECVIEKPTRAKKEPFKDIMVAVFYGMLLGLVTGLVVGTILADGLGTDDAVANWSLLICIGMGAFLPIRAAVKSEEDKNIAYAIELNAYSSRVRQNQDRIKNENKEIIFWKREVENIEKSIAYTNKLLQNMYGRGIIFPKYQNFVMISSVFEYISSGRCASLEGHEGAYNILELEIRLDRIILNLDRIISNLEEIKKTQYVLYSAVKDSNRKIDQLINANQQMINQVDKLASDYSDKLDGILRSTQTTAYYAQRIQNELHYMNRMDYLCGENDGTIFNFPPY